MKVCAGIWFIGCCAGVVAEVNAQQATVVHLPTNRHFSVQTSVAVPVGGTAGLGGVSSSWGRSSRRGLVAPDIGGNGWRGIRVRGVAGTAVRTSVQATTDPAGVSDRRWQVSSRSAMIGPGVPWIRGAGQGKDAEAIARRIEEIRRLQLRE